MRLPDVTIDARSHPSQRIHSRHSARVAQRHAQHRGPGGRRTQDEIRRGRLPDLTAVGQEGRQLGLGIRAQRGPHSSERLLRIVGHLDHAAVVVAVTEARVESAQADHLVHAQSGPGEEPGEHLGQGQHTGAGFHHNPVHLDDPGLAARARSGLEHPHRKPAGHQRQGRGQPADAGPNHQDLGTALSRHGASCGRRPAAPVRRGRPGPADPTDAAEGRSRAGGQRDGCGTGAHRLRPGQLSR